MTNIFKTLKRQFLFHRLRHNRYHKALVKEARKSDWFGCYDMFYLVDAKLALVQNAYEEWDVYRNQEYDLRDIKLLRKLIHTYQEKSLVEFIDGKLVSIVTVNPRTAWKFAAEMCPCSPETQKYCVEHPEIIYEYKLKRLIWKLLAVVQENASL